MQLLCLTPETACVVELEPNSGAIVSSFEVASHLLHIGDILKVGGSSHWGDRDLNSLACLSSSDPSPPPCSLFCLQILPGGRIPTDGVVVSGEGFVNEAMISGEAKPAYKHPGDPVVGGTVSQGGGGVGLLLIRVTRVGSDTVLSQIVRLVQQAQMSKAPVQVSQLGEVFIGG